MRNRSTWIAGVLGAALVTLVATEVRAVTVTRALDAPASLHFQRADAALAAGDVAGAARHWRDGHARVLASRRWEGLVEAGDLYRRIGARGGFHAAALARARECYLTALLRARAERSLDGVLHATEAFLDLGDEQVVERGLDVARRLAAAGADPRGRARVDLLAARWAARSASTGRSTTENLR
jgi:hypothetical protein